MRGLVQDCHLGYTFEMLEDALHPDTHADLMKWMRGQTMSLCEGDTNPSCRHQGDAVIYKWDFDRFLSGRENL